MAIGIVVLGIVVSIGITIVTNVRDSGLTRLSTVQTANESISVKDTGTTLANTWGQSVAQVYNATNGAKVALGNYTTSINPGTGYITITNSTQNCAAGYCVQPWKVTYTWYNTSSPDWQSADKAAAGLGEYGNWFKIIVIVGVAAVILSLIFMAFGKKGSSGQAY